MLSNQFYLSSCLTSLLWSFVIGEHKHTMKISKLKGKFKKNQQLNQTHKMACTKRTTWINNLTQFHFDAFNLNDWSFVWKCTNFRVISNFNRNDMVCLRNERNWKMENDLTHRWWKNICCNWLFEKKKKPITHNT